MNSQTIIFSIDGVEYAINKVEAKQKREQEPERKFNEYQTMFASKILPYYRDRFFRRARTHGFYSAIKQMCIIESWEYFLIAEARKRGFISHCTIKTALSIDKMKSGRLQLIGLSKLATCGRKQIIIYDNGKWIAEAISNEKQRLSGHYWVQVVEGEIPTVLYYSQLKGWFSSLPNYTDSDIFKIWPTKLDEPKW